MVKEQIFLETNRGNVDDKIFGMRKKYNIIYADEDVKKIFSVLESELKTCKSKYQDNSNKESKFTLR